MMLILDFPLGVPGIFYLVYFGGAASIDWGGLEQA